MEKIGYYKALKKIGVSYIGKVTQTAKMKYSFRNGVCTYCIYLAPSNMAFGGNKTICPNDKHCKEFCLNGSGHNKADILSHGIKDSIINKSRIKKTKAFFQDKETFMFCVIHEIRYYQKYAEEHNMDFAIRLNGTSDLNPKIFTYQNKNLLELFPNVQFYDYTKVPYREKLTKEYDNYDLTFSFDGYNWEKCEEMLKNNIRVAIIFHGNKLPKLYKNYKVIDGNTTDIRFKDEKNVIVGLHYHTTANDYKSGKYIIPINNAIILENDINCKY